MGDFLEQMAHFHSNSQDFRQKIDAKVDHMLEILASMQQHLQMQEMTKGKEIGVGLCGAEIQSQHQIVTSATSCEEAESGAKIHIENLELVFEKPYANAKLQSYSEKLVLMCEQQVFDEISKPGKLEIFDAPVFTCEHKFDKVPKSTLIVPNHADVVRKVEVQICPLGVLDLTEVTGKIVAPLENFQSIEVSLNTVMIEREETKLKIGDYKNEADRKPVLVVVFSRGKGVIMFDELKVFDYLTDKKFDPGGDAILEVAGKFGNELCSKNCSRIVFSHDSDQELYERQLLVGFLSLFYSCDYNNDGKFSNEGFHKMSNYYGCDGSVQGIFHPFPFYRSSYQGYDGCGQLKAGEKEGKLKFSDYRVEGVNPFLFLCINVFEGSSKEEFFIEELVKISGENEVENELKKFSSLHSSRRQIRPYARIGDTILSILGGGIAKAEVRLIWAAGTCDKTNPHFWITPYWPWQQEGMSTTMRIIWKRKRIKILCFQSVAIQPSSPNRSDDSLQPYINSKRVNCKIQGVDKWTSTIYDSLEVVELVDLCLYILQHTIAWKQTIKLPILGKGQMSNRCNYLVTNEDHRLCIETKLIEEVAGMRFHLHFLGIFLGVRLQLFAPKFDGYAGKNNFQFPELVDFFCEYYSYLIHNKNEQDHQLYLCGGIAVILFARKGNEPLVVASGGFSGIFSDSSWNTYFVAGQTCLQNVYALCDVQLTEDGSGIIVDKLKREYKVEANAGASQVNYRASISKVIEVKFVQKKQSSPPNFRLSLFSEHKNCGLNGLWRGKILPDFGVVTPVEAPSQVNDQYFTNLLLEINARLDVVSSILAMIVVGVGTVISSSVTIGNKEISVLMFDQPLSKPPSQFRHLSRGDTTLSRGEYCCGNGMGRKGGVGGGQ